jgi:GNAT superfamily N-acetyltransferase
MLKIRLLEHSELPLLKDFAPPEWNTDLSVTFSFHFGYPYYYPVVADLEGIMVGCAQGLLNGEVGWLGNIITLPEYRGQGIGQALTQHLVEFFRAKGCTSQILVATQLGEPVYHKLGFIEVSRYVFLKRADPLEPEPTSRVRQAKEKDFPCILALDREATGEERAPFLGRFFETAWVYEKGPSEGVEGFYLPDLRDGPLIARAEQSGLALLKFKLGQGRTSVVVPEGNIPALDFLKGAGFAEFDSAPRMALGKDADWKPAWVFSRGAGYCG